MFEDLTLREDMREMLERNFEVYALLAPEDTDAKEFMEFIKSSDGVQKSVDLYFEKFSIVEIGELLHFFKTSVRFNESSLGKKCVGFTTDFVIPMVTDFIKEFEDLKYKEDAIVRLNEYKDVWKT